jgi:hypothetical protein
MAKRTDQRGTPRRAAGLQAEVSLGEEDRHVQVANISRGGLMFSTPAPARVPAIMHLTVALPGGEHITLTSSVRHVARRADTQVVEVGVQFAALDADEGRALDSALASLPPAH